MMQKISVKRSCEKKLDKSGSTDRTSSGRARSSRTHKNTTLFVKEGNQPVAERNFLVILASGEHADCRMTLFVLKELSAVCVKGFLRPASYR